MKNIDLKIEGDELVLRMNLKDRHGPSKSGKTTIVASSEGNQLVPYEGLKTEDMYLGLNLYTKKTKDKN